MEIDSPMAIDFSSKENFQLVNANTQKTNISKTTKQKKHSRRSGNPPKNSNSSVVIKVQKQKETNHSLKRDNETPFLLTLVETLQEKANEQSVFLMENEEHLFLLDNSLLRSVCTECAHISTKDTVDQIPREPLLQFFSVLQKQISASFSLIYSSETLPVILASLDASLSILHIMTAKSAPKYVLVEESIESIVTLAKFHLKENLFPHFDVTITPAGEKPKEKELKKLFNKLGEILEKGSLLVSRVRLTDGIILNFTSISLPTFFIDGVETLHLRSINLLRSIFAQYPDHRNAIIQEIFHSLLKLPTGKRNLRKYKLVDEGKSIQMVSALLIQLIQCCVTSLSESAFAESTAVCRTILNLFIQRCTTRSAHQIEYKHLLENLIADLLIVLFLPEWPAAEMMVSMISAMLIHILNSAAVASIKKGGMPELNTKKTKEQDQLRLMALKWLGTISTKMATEIQSAKRFTVFEDRKRTNTEAMPSDEEEDASCICNQGFQEKFMLDCDRCNVWFHGECVGISPSDIPDVWYCDTCRILLQAQEKLVLTKSKKGESKDILCNKATRELVSLQLIVNYLMTNDSNSVTARRFVLGSFKKNHTGNDEIGICDDLWHQVPRRGISELSLSYKGTINLIRYLNNESEFLTRFQSVLAAILSVCNDRQMSFRATAVKSIASIIDANPALLGESEICKVVNERRLDVSVSVRQAIVDLVGNYILFQPSFVSQYYDMIVDRIADTGISVRKRVIKILMNICTQDPSNPLVISICSKLVSRMNDEDSIRSIVLRTFQELWFNDSNKTKNCDINTKLAQIYAVTNSTASHQWFVDLVKSLLAGDKPRHPVVRDITQKMCHSIIESMIELEESQTQTNPITKQLIQCLTVLNLFCQADAELLKPHALTLQPYLQTEQSKTEGASVYCQVIEILEGVMPLLKDSMSSEFLLGLEEDLSHLIHTHSSMKVVQAAARCLCVVVATMTNHSIFLEEMLSSFREALVDPQLSHDEPAMCMRYLFTAGLLCRYYDFDLKQSANTWKQNKKSSKSQSFALFTILLQYTEESNPSIRIKALQGLGHLLVRFPSLMVKCNNLFRTILQTPNHPCKLNLLKNFGDFLLQEQQSLEGNSKNVQPIRDQSDCGSRVIQANIDLILPLLFHSNAILRIDAIQVIGQLIKHGLAHPIKVVSSLVALLADRTPTIAEQAMHWLQFIHQKNPPLLLSRLADGIKLSYQFQQTVFQHANALIVSKTSHGPESLLANLYRLFRTKRNTRDQFLNIIINLLYSSVSLSCSSSESKTGLTTNGSFLKYLADLLVFLPFDIVGEPLSVIHSVDQIISLKTGAILKSFKTELKKEKSSASALTFHCMNACLPIMLIKIKAFLKWGYSISTRKCENYIPSDAANNSACIKLIDTASIMSPFSGIPVLNATEKISKQLAQQQYDLLKQLFMQDDTDTFTKVAPKVAKQKKQSSSTKPVKPAKKTPNQTPKKTKRRNTPKHTDIPRRLQVTEPTRKRSRVNYAEVDDDRPRKRAKLAHDEEDEFVPIV